MVHHSSIIDSPVLSYTTHLSHFVQAVAPLLLLLPPFPSILPSCLPRALIFEGLALRWFLPVSPVHICVARINQQVNPNAG